MIINLPIKRKQHTKHQINFSCNFFGTWIVVVESCFGFGYLFKEIRETILGKTMGKKKNVDFQKVKLKVGRSLKKNLNITDTSFKVKKILIKEQLKSETKQLTTHRKLSLKELFTRLGHHNTTSRHDALVGLKELFTEHPELVISSLSSSIEKITEMVLDKDHVVRKAALKTLETAFKHLTSNQILPFFPILKSYLSCATTHTLIDIRDDSLYFLDLLLKYFPDLTTSTCSRILESLLKHLAHRPTKTLTMQSRALLLRVDSFLIATMDAYKSKCHNVKDTSQEIEYKNLKTTSISLHKAHRINPINDNNFQLHQHSVVSCNESILINEECAVNLLNAIHPLLVEVLMECKFSSSFHSPGMFKDFFVTLELIQHTLNVINVLEECAMTCNLKTGNNKTLELFRTHFKFTGILKFMMGFPFTFNKTKSAKFNESSCLTLNMLACSVFITMFPEVNSETEDLYNNLVEYITQICTNNAISGVDHTKQVLKVLTKLSKTNISPALSEKLLHSLYVMYKKQQVVRKDHDLVMRYITSLALNSNHTAFKESSAFAYWLSSLPMDLVEIANKSPSFLCFHTKDATLLALRGLPLYLQGLQESHLAVIDLLNIVCEKMPQESNLHFQIVELISLLPQLSVESFLALTSIIQKSSVPVEPVLHLLELLHERFVKKCVPGFDIETFLGFLLSIMLGIMKQDIPSLYEKCCEDKNISALKEIVPASMTAFSIIPSDEIVWQKHIKLVERTSDLILSFEDVDNLSNSIEEYLGRAFVQLHCLPMHSAASVLVLQSKIAKKYPINNTFLCILADLAFSLLLHSVAALKVVPNCDSKVECILKVVCQFLSELDVSVNICDIMLNQLKVSSEEQVATLCSAWCLLLNFNLLDSDQILLVHTTFQNIEFQFPTVTEKMWWKELNYLFSAKVHHLE